MIKEKIKAVIFDFGQVLVHFEPEYILAEAIEDGFDRKRAADVLFSREYYY